MKKADLLRLMAAIIYPAVDDVEQACIIADQIADNYDALDHNEEN